MTSLEVIELGHLLERHQRALESVSRGFPADEADELTATEERRLVELGLRAHRELPTGETEVVRQMRVDGEWQDRLIAVEKVLLRVVETLGTQLGAVAVGALQAEVDTLLKRQ